MWFSFLRYAQNELFCNTILIMYAIMVVTAVYTLYDYLIFVIIAFAPLDLTLKKTSGIIREAAVYFYRKHTVRITVSFET